MNYPVWPDSGVAYPRTLLNNMRSLPAPPVSSSASHNQEDGNKCPPKYSLSGTDPQRTATAAAAAAAAAAATAVVSSRLNNDDCASGRGQVGSAEKYASLSSYSEDDSLLKVRSSAPSPASFSLSVL